MASHNVKQFFAYGKTTHKVFFIYYLAYFFSYSRHFIITVFITEQTISTHQEKKAQRVGWFLRRDQTIGCYVIFEGNLEVQRQAVPRYVSGISNP